MELQRLSGLLNIISHSEFIHVVFTCVYHDEQKKIYKDHNFFVQLRANFLQ